SITYRTERFGERASKWKAAGSSIILASLRAADRLVVCWPPSTWRTIAKRLVDTGAAPALASAVWTSAIVEPSAETPAGKGSVPIVGSRQGPSSCTLGEADPSIAS